ncbi:MAG: polysaccharide deacetylase family protein [Clostridia bacterium]|nr:polysaccharide deacetylase family protein [Clostridia bacterium]
MRYIFMRFPGGKAKAVTLSYDDGKKQDKRLSDLFTANGMKCTFNLNGDAYRGQAGLSKEEVIEHILKPGHEIALHGYCHRAPGGLRPLDGIKDILDNRLELEQKYDRIIRGLAYPDFGITRFENGASYEQIKSYLTHLDIAYARSLGGDNNRFSMPTDWHNWVPTASHNNPKLMEWIEEFLALDIKNEGYPAAREPRLFFLWGHSSEYDDKDNWHLIETVCEKLAGHEDVWYATNMEIYEYSEAYQSLVFSADGKKVYNPTLFTLCFEVDMVAYTISPGETITL